MLAVSPFDRAQITGRKNLESENAPAGDRIQEVSLRIKYADRLCSFGIPILVERRQHFEDDIAEVQRSERVITVLGLPPCP